MWHQEVGEELETEQINKFNMSIISYSEFVFDTNLTEFLKLWHQKTGRPKNRGI